MGALLEPVRIENLRIVLVRTRNPLNVGAVARAMSNFGALDLRLVAPYEKAFREAVSAVGAEKLLADAKEFASIEEAVRDCSLVVGTTAIGNRELQHELYALPDATKRIHGKLRFAPVAVVFGSEKTGLTNTELSHCHWLLRIPTREGHRSMNLAQAVAVVVYELARGAKLPAKKVANSRLVEADASMESLGRIAAALREALDISGYIHRRSAADAEEKLRRMLLRFDLNTADAEVLLGMLRKILWKLKESPP